MTLTEPVSSMFERPGWRVKCAVFTISRNIKWRMIVPTALPSSRVINSEGSSTYFQIWKKVQNAIDGPRRSNGVEVRRYYRSP